MLEELELNLTRLMESSCDVRRREALKGVSRVNVGEGFLNARHSTLRMVHCQPNFGLVVG